MHYITYLSTMQRRKKIALQVVLDAVLVTTSFFAAMFLRLENIAFLGNSKVWGAMGVALVAALLAFGMLGLYRALVRHITEKILIAVGLGAVIAAFVLYTAGLVIGAGLPRSVPIIFAVFIFLSVGGLRFSARMLFRRPKRHNKKPVIIYGAGEAGRQLLNVLIHGRDYTPIAFVDDDPALQNLAIGGLKVIAPDQIPQLIQRSAIAVILLAIPSVRHARRREIVSELEDLQIEIKTIPGISEIITGKAKISELRTVSAEDLLGRDPVAPIPELLEKNTKDCVVMVSGAGGSIGSELCRQILAQQPAVLLLYDVSEIALYAIEAELTAAVEFLQSATKIVPVLGSVQHSRRLEATIKAFNVQTIYHAAAYKHVPIVEENVVEGIRNNVFGTLAITAAAKKFGVENFILVSTDKAVRPTNIMGATKRIGELICQAHAREKSVTTFSTVRFGNVLGSSGSVIPRFRAQIENGGPITVTHRDITRYFMTIPEAAQLVIQAGALAKGGDVFVLDMGEPIRIMDLAISMVKLHGLTPYQVDHPDQISPSNGDIPISITGLRKGEKLYEELLIGDNPSPTEHPRIMTAAEVSMPMNVLQAVLDRLMQACQDFNVPRIIAILLELPLGYEPSNSDISDVLWNADVNDAEQFDLAIKKRLGM